MSREILITIGQVRCRAVLNDTACAAAIYESLPLEASANTWGEEVYFDIGLACGEADDARVDMDVGEVGYWPPGRAVCLFFGRTPASGADGRPRAASKVNPIGRLVGEPGVLQGVGDGETVHLAAVQAADGGE